MSMETSKKSRAAHLGIVTREKNKHLLMVSQDPSKFDTRKFNDRIKRMEEKQKEYDDIQAQIYAIGDENLDPDEEQSAVLKFEANVEETIDLLRHLIDLKQVHLAIRDLNRELDSLSKAKDELPEKNHSLTINRHRNSYEKLKHLLNQSTIDFDHPYHSDVERIQERLSFLSTEDKSGHHQALVNVILVRIHFTQGNLTQSTSPRSRCPNSMVMSWNGLTFGQGSPQQSTQIQI